MIQSESGSTKLILLAHEPFRDECATEVPNPAHQPPALSPHLSMPKTNRPLAPYTRHSAGQILLIDSVSNLSVSQLASWWRDPYNLQKARAEG